MTERIEYLAWQRRTNQLIELADVLGWPAGDEPSTLLDPAMAGEEVARG